MTSTSNLDTIGEKVSSRFSAEDSAREKALRLCRDVIRYSSNAIRAVHRREYAQASGLLDSGNKALVEVKQILADHQGLFYSGFVHNSQK